MASRSPFQPTPLCSEIQCNSLYTKHITSISSVDSPSTRKSPPGTELYPINKSLKTNCNTGNNSGKRFIMFNIPIMLKLFITPCKYKNKNIEVALSCLGYCYLNWELTLICCPWILFVINSLQNFTLLTPANSIFTPNIILFQWKFQVLFVRHLSTLSADKFFLEGTSGGVFSLCFNLLYSSRCKNCIPRILQLTNVIGYKIIFVIARLSSTLVT